MAYTESTRKKRAEAREAASAARRQRLEDEKANYRALRAFLDAKYRLAKVDIWLDARVTELHAQADARRTPHRLAVAEALADMTARGMTVNEIARMAGMTAKEVTDCLQPAKVEERTCDCLAACFPDTSDHASKVTTVQVQRRVAFHGLARCSWSGATHDAVGREIAFHPSEGLGNKNGPSEEGPSGQPPGGGGGVTPSE